jgi:hypothetical protein
MARYDLRTATTGNSRDVHFQLNKAGGNAGDKLRVRNDYRPGTDANLQPRGKARRA